MTDDPFAVFNVEGRSLTPRTAAALHYALDSRAAYLDTEIELLGDAPLDSDDGSLLAEFPRITYRMDAAWRAQLVQAHMDLADDIYGGGDPFPRCVAEEVALLLAINVADEDGEFGGLPEHDDDFDWDVMKEHLFQDLDAETLFNPRFDGIEDPEDPVNQHLRIGDMRPAAWFTTFANMPARDH